MDYPPRIHCSFVLKVLEATCDGKIRRTTAQAIEDGTRRVAQLTELLHDPRTEGAFQAIYKTARMEVLSDLDLTRPDDRERYFAHQDWSQDTITTGLEHLVSDTLRLPPDQRLVFQLECAFRCHVSGLHCGRHMVTNYNLAYSVPLRARGRHQGSYRETNVELDRALNGGFKALRQQGETPRTITQEKLLRAMGRSMEDSQRIREMCKRLEFPSWPAMKQHYFEQAAR